MSLSWFSFGVLLTFLQLFAAMVVSRMVSPFYLLVSCLRTVFVVCCRRFRSIFKTPHMYIHKLCEIVTSGRRVQFTCTICLSCIVIDGMSVLMSLVLLVISLVFSALICMPKAV